MPDQAGDVVTYPVDPAAVIRRRAVVAMSAAGLREATDSDHPLGLADSDSPAGSAIDIGVVVRGTMDSLATGPLTRGEPVAASAGRLVGHPGDGAAFGVYTGPGLAAGVETDEAAVQFPFQAAEPQLRRPT